MTNLPRMVRVRDEARWSEEEDALLRLRYGGGKTLVELARLHGRELPSIRIRLIRLGVLPPDSRTA